MAITRHSLFLNLSGISELDITKMNQTLTSLMKSPELGIIDFSGLKKAHDTQETKEGLNRGYTHSFTMVFITAAHRDNYLPHPIHLAAIEQLQQLGIKTSNVCSLDVDANLSASEAQRLIKQFQDKHKIGIKDIVGLLSNRDEIARATKEIATTISEYISSLTERDSCLEFWGNLQKSLFTEVTLNNTRSGYRHNL